MRTNLNLLVSFFIRKKRNNPEKASVYIRISVNSVYRDISLKKTVTISKWDSKANRAKGTSNEARILNNFLNKTSTQIHRHYDKLLEEEVFVTVDKLKARFLGTDQQHKTLMELVGYHNTQMLGILTPGTLKNYKTTENYLKLFLNGKKKTTDVFLKEIDYKFTLDFEAFLRKQDKLHNNGVMKHMERLKKMMNLAMDMEWIGKNPTKRFKLRFDPVDMVYLSQSELEAIFQKQYKRPCLELTKDIFIFACYTGLAYIDVRNLEKGNIHLGIDGGKWIYTQRKKTKTTVRIPLLPEAEKIIQKYKGHPKLSRSEKLLPILSNQKTNEYLKTIAKQADVPKKLSFHAARHTFATTVTLANGVPIETVSKLLGHNKIATTQIYARVIDTKISQDMAKLRNSLSENSSQKLG